METTAGHTSDTTSPDADSAWSDVDVATMRVHSRARVLQSKQRAQRLGRESTALGHMLEAAMAQRIMEEQITRQEQREITMTEPDPKRDRDALIDLAAAGERQHAEANRPPKPGPSLRHLQTSSRFDAIDDLPPVDADSSQDELDLRDRSALLDLRREHEHVARQRVTVLRDSQPRSAVSDRRWG